MKLLLIVTIIMIIASNAMATPSQHKKIKHNPNQTEFICIEFTNQK